MKKLFNLFCAFLFVSSCTGKPEGVEPVRGFDVNRYLGTWYEIARLDHSFERGLSQVTAEYSLKDNGDIRVINRGYSSEKEEWSEAEGKAKFTDKSDEGHLKVSFFGPFYGSYIIFELDKENYDYAFICGPNKAYLWFLSRTKTVSPALRNHFFETAKRLGFNTEELIFVEQE